MKNTKQLFIFLATGFLALAIGADDRGTWRPGVGVDVNPGPFDQDVTFTIDGASLTVKGTPDISGDSWDVEDSDEATVSGRTVRFRKGKVEEKQTDGSWKPLGRPLGGLKSEGQGSLPRGESWQ